MIYSSSREEQNHAKLRSIFCLIKDQTNVFFSCSVRFTDLCREGMQFSIRELMKKSNVILKC